MAGAKAQWPQKVRDIALGHVFERDMSARAVALAAQAGELEGLEAIPLKPGTVQQWAAKERLKRAAQDGPNQSTQDRDIARVWRLATAALDQLEADLAEGKTLDPKRVKDAGVMIRDRARYLAAPDLSQPESDEESIPPPSILERLTARKDRTAASNPTTNPRPTENATTGAAEPKNQQDSGERMASPVLARIDAGQPVVADPS